MKVAIVLALVALAAASFDISELNNFGPAGQDLYNAIQQVKSDPCYQNAAESAMPQIRSLVEGVMAKTTQPEQAAEELYEIFESVQAQLKNCNSAAFTSLALAEISNDGEATPTDLQLLADVFLASSQCFQDIGGVLYLLDAIKQDPSNIPQDIIVGIFTVMYTKKAIHDCGVVPAIIGELIHH